MLEISLVIFSLREKNEMLLVFNMYTDTGDFIWSRC